MRKAQSEAASSRPSKKVKEDVIEEKGEQKELDPLQWKFQFRETLFNALETSSDKYVNAICVNELGALVEKWKDNQTGPKQEKLLIELDESLRCYPLPRDLSDLRAGDAKLRRILKSLRRQPGADGEKGDRLLQLKVGFIEKFDFGFTEGNRYTGYSLGEPYESCLNFTFSEKEEKEPPSVVMKQLILCQDEDFRKWTALAQGKYSDELALRFLEEREWFNGGIDGYKKENDSDASDYDDEGEEDWYGGHYDGREEYEQWTWVPVLAVWPRHPTSSSSSSTSTN